MAGDRRARKDTNYTNLPEFVSIRVIRVFSLFAVILLSNHCPAQPFLDNLQDNLKLQTKDGFIRSDLTVLLDLEGYYVDQRPPGLLYEDESFINYRASFFIDAHIGPHFYSLIQARVDRGFDPGSQDLDARLDEYLLRWTPTDDSRLNIQFGKFATAVGGWVQRHDSWQNPLITAPLPYENPTIVSYDDVPTSPADFLYRRSYPDDKDSWIPVIWGPVYATGGSIFGSIGKMDYAFEVKNAAISSHPDAWDVDQNYWRYPTFSARIGFRPSPAWNHGLSFSDGAYMTHDAAAQLPAGKNIGDYRQLTLDYDVSYAFRKWELWAELFLNRFQVPNVGDADLGAYYIEAKYKITAGLYAAARWNQEIFGTVHDGSGGWEAWDHDMFRADAALGYRFTRHLQTKLQYSFGHRNGSLQQGEQLVAAQVTAKF
ncbi:MAG: hypothetical protein C5B50_25625 [Verrucomicrobia bacterium]|nr:MAG: hypothetical protein C5B50_25625 [Verrucomicrobiota bacterium]